LFADLAGMKNDYSGYRWSVQDETEYKSQALEQHKQRKYMRRREIIPVQDETEMKSELYISLH
jgi:hypothetical protein